jgi:hypothetical protein
LKWRKWTSSEIEQVLKTDQFCPTGPDREGGGGPQLGWKKNKGGGWAKIKKKNFRIKNWIFEFTEAWKFTQGDLGGILTLGFFLNSSRLLKDFRKI